MPASISTRLDEQEFLDLADFYYVNPRPEMTDNPSLTGSTTTLSTNHTHLRRRATTPGPRWRPSTLIECDDPPLETDGLPRCDTAKRQTIVFDRRGELKNSALLDYDSDDTQSFRTAKEHDLGKPTDGFLGTASPPQNQIPQIDTAIRPSSSATRISRPISTASIVPGSCFGIFPFLRWNVKGFYHSSSFRLKKQKKAQCPQSIKRGVGEGSRHDFSIISLDYSQSDEEYFASSSARGLASASSPFIGLDYDYHLAVEVLINGSNVDSPSMP